VVETVASIVDRVQPERTVLLFGAGSSVPSKAPTSEALADFVANRFGLPHSGFSLPEIASLAERKAGRRSQAVVGAVSDAHWFAISNGRKGPRAPHVAA
jgi:hypothetical protein